MEINDIIKLMEAVADNGLTSFELEEGNIRLSLKKKNETQQILTVAGAPMIGEYQAGQQALMNGVSCVNTGMNSVVVPTAPAGGSSPSIETDKVITSPLVGTFYNCASPEADVFVKTGDMVKKGQVLGIIEAMKLMNEIESEFDGVVEAVLVNNEDVVEYGQPLFRIR